MKTFTIDSAIIPGDRMTRAIKNYSQNLSFSTIKYDVYGQYITGICCMLLAFFVPTSITFSWIFYLLTVLATLSTPKLREQLSEIIKQPIAIMLLLYMMLYVLASVYSQADAHERMKDISKHYWILGTIFIMPILNNSEWRRRILNMFVVGNILTLLITYYLIYPHLHDSAFSETSAVYTYIQQSFFLAITAGILLYKAVNFAEWRKVNIFLFVLCAIYLVAISKSRTGYGVFFIVICFFTYNQWKWRGLKFAVVGLLLTFSACYLFSNTFHYAINEVIVNSTRPFQEKVATNSIDIRAVELKNATYLFKERPWFGYGTGGVKAALATLPPGWDARAHMLDQFDLDYFNIAVRFGIVGILLFLGLLAVAWRQAYYSEPYFRFIICISILSFAFSCIFNDFTHRAMTGLFLSLILAFTAYRDSNSQPKTTGDQSKC